MRTAARATRKIITITCIFLATFSGCLARDTHSNLRGDKLKIEDQNHVVATNNEIINVTNVSDNNVNTVQKKQKANQALAGYYDTTKPRSAPKFTHPSKLYTMDMKPAGSSIRFKCMANGNPMPNITWFKNNGSIDRNYFPPTYGKWWMSLEELMKTDNGNYTCLICNELGCISHTVNLQVQERYPSKPFVKEGYPGNKTVEDYDTITLSCPTLSDLEPYIYWIKAFDNFTNTEINGLTEQIIPDGYEVKRLFSKPILMKGPTSQEILIGETAKFRCEFLSDLHYYVFWLFFNNYAEFENITNFNDPLPKNAILTDDPEDKPEMLTIANVTQEDQGWYICVAINTLGHDTAKGYLTVKRPNSNETFNTIGESTTQSISNPLIGIIALVVVFLLTIIINTGITFYRRRSSVVVKYWVKTVTVEKLLSEPGDWVMPRVKIEKQRLAQVGKKAKETAYMSEYQMPVDAQWEIPRSNISCTGQLLGEGEFGKVVKAQSQGLVSEDAKTVVAVKMLKDGYTDADMISLVSEMEIMKMIGKHENIINLLGCCTQDGPLYIVVEYARNGCLRDYLRKHKPQKCNGRAENSLNKPLTQRNLIDFVWQVAKGMEYLASRGCIHRDLAARNVLVSEDLMLKIADFGLARDVHDSDYYRKRTAGKLPIKWMAPESISQNYYDKRSDVWSFGVITWEIMAFGEMPYAKISVFKLYNYLETNHRLQKPAACSSEMYELMKSCWKFKPEDRPSFEDIVSTIRSMLNHTENGPPPENLNEYVTMLS